MAHPDVKTEAQARTRIEADTQTFLNAFDYQAELGVFTTTWAIYKEIPLARFREAVPQEDRMVLPGMEIPIDVAHVAIQTFGAVWEDLLRVAVGFGGRQLYRLVRKRALEAGAPRDLAGKLADFFTKRFAKSGQSP